MANRTTLFGILALSLFSAAAAPSVGPATRPSAAASTAPGSKASAATSTAPAGALAIKRSVLDGVYTNEQLERGKKGYLASCVRCHGDTLLGNDDAPALVGTDFLQEWTGQTVGNLEEYTRTSMPSDGPGKMTRREITDIIAYILNANGFPVGKAELPPDLDELNGIMIEVKK